MNCFYREDAKERSVPDSVVIPNGCEGAYRVAKGADSSSSLGMTDVVGMERSVE